MAEAQNITVKTGGSWWLLLVGMVIGVAVGLYVREWFQGGEVTKSSDTTYVKEIQRVPYPIEVNRFKDQSVMMIPLWLKSEKEVKDTVVVNDTVFLYVHREFKEYRGDSYFARVSGYSPSLDYIEVYPETKVVTNTKRVVYKNFLSAGVEVGMVDNLSVPIYFEYKRMVHKNVGVYGRVMHDVASGCNGVSVGVQAQFGW